MGKITFKVALIALFIFSISSVFAQTDTLNDVYVTIKMKNGEIYKGKILRKNDKIILHTLNGEINLIPSNISSIKNYDNASNLDFTDLHNTRYFLGPTGIPLKKGEGYYQNILVTTNSITYGITKNFSISGGFELITSLIGPPIWFLNPKVRFDLSKNVHVGGGLIIIGAGPGDFDSGSLGVTALGYGVVTLGNPKTNLSLGFGYGSSTIDTEAYNYPATMISGTHKISRKIALLSENYIFRDSFGDRLSFGIHGIKILSKKNSFDVGLVIIPEFIVAFPYVGYARAF